MRKITMVAGLLVLVPALATAQQDTAKQRDTTPVTQDTSYGRLATPPAPMNAAALGLSTAQVKELQRSLTTNGCDAGPVDGMLTEKTQQAIACYRTKKGITGGDLNDVLKSLHLSFRAKTNPMGDSTSSRHDTSGAKPRHDR